MTSISALPPLRPVIMTMIGDPAGIGPEVIARAWASGRVHECSIPVLIGSAAAMERAIDFAGVTATVRTLRSLDSLSDRLSDNPAIIDILDSGALDPAALPLAEDTAAAGEATAVWLDQMDAIARSGAVGASIMGPISTGSLKLVNKLDKVISPTPGAGYLVLISGPLRVAHLTDHMPIRRVCEVLNPRLVEIGLTELDAAMRRWGIAAPRIIVSGLNPHALGDEERDAIAPGVERARAAGIDVQGPTSPDTVFRQCIEGRYDMVLAMYHDQGHIAVKTWGFSGNCAIIMGPPYLHMSVGHGTAYDIVGKGLADSTMMLSAMRTAGHLAAGRGFPSDG